MARITDYASLVDTIIDRMNDASMSDYAAEFVQMAESMFNRRLNNLDMEGTATIAASVTLPLPADYKGAMSIRIDEEAPMKQLGADDFLTKWRDQTGRPENFSIYGGMIHLGPNPDGATYTVTMTYLRTLTGLSSTNTTNWLLEAHPDLYLYGALAEAEARGWNNEQAVFYSDRVESAIAEINRYDARRRRGNQTDVVSVSYF